MDFNFQTKTQMNLSTYKIVALHLGIKFFIKSFFLQKRLGLHFDIHFACKHFVKQQKAKGTQ